MEKNVRNTNEGNENILPLEKFSLDTEEDPKKIFNFPFLIDSETISRIKNHGRVMFIIRGPPYTKKTKLSDILRETYPGSPFCSKVKLLENFETKDDSSNLRPETVHQTKEAWIKKVTEACLSKKSTIIIQNSHMRKMEMKPWFDLAAEFDYIVIMAATMYKFDITPEALVREGGLNMHYLRERVNIWEDVPPLFTAWFISPNDSEYMRIITFEKLKAILEIQKFRLWFGTEDITSYFQPRSNLCCLAGYSAEADAMKKYYFSNDVQKVYGKCFPIFIIGFLITKTDIIGVAQLNENAISLVKDDMVKSNENIASGTRNISQYGKTTKFPQQAKLPPKSSGNLKIWMKGEKVSAEMCRPIHIAKKGFDTFNVEKVSEQFYKGLQLMSNSDDILKERYFDIRNENSSGLHELKDDVWFINITEKLCFSTIFTGFYA